MKKRLICFMMIGAVVLGLCSCQNQQKEEIAQVDLLEENFEQTAQVPQQSASLPVFDKENDPQAVEYLKMQYQVQENEDIDSIVQRMWYLGNFIYFAGRRKKIHRTAGRGILSSGCMEDRTALSSLDERIPDSQIFGRSD